MKNLCATSLALVLVLVFVQSPSPSEALKIKKVVKDAAKLSKKYGYLLASRKKKLYAVPFPMPLPVFVKRQHIYTQVPIIPRYVQHPQPYGSPAHSAEASSYEPMASLPTSSSASSLYEASSETSPQRPRTKKGASSSSSSSASSSQQDTPSYLGGTGSSAASTGKYLSQLASILGQSVPIFGNAGNANRDLLTKLLNGQAKVLPPTSLISAIKGPSAALAKYQHQQDSSQEQDQDSKSESGSTASDHTQSSSGNTETTKSPGEPSSASTAADTNRPSASELHRSRYRVPYYASMRNPYGMLADPRRIPAAAMFASPMVSPFAALAAAQSPALMPRIPISQMAAASQYLAMLDPHASQLDQMESQSSEPSELAANPIRQGQQNQAADEQAAIDQSQLLEQRRRLLKLALLKERQEAERLLESRLVLARAKQISQQLGQQLPSAQQQTAQLMNQLRQQQVAQQLQQMRYIQLVQQHQQQLQQNTIDNQ